MYGLFPFVVEQFRALVDESNCVGVSVTRRQGRWRVDCHAISESGVRSLVLCVVPLGVDCEKRIIELTVPLLSCCLDFKNFVAVTVDRGTRLGRAVAACLTSQKVVVAQRFHVDWVMEKMRRRFVTDFQGLEPFSVLDYLTWRLLPVVDDPVFDQFPNLRRVSVVRVYIFLFC